MRLLRHTKNKRSIQPWTYVSLRAWAQLIRILPPDLFDISHLRTHENEKVRQTLNW